MQIVVVGKVRSVRMRRAILVDRCHGAQGVRSQDLVDESRLRGPIRSILEKVGEHLQPLLCRLFTADFRRAVRSPKNEIAVPELVPPVTVIQSRAVR